jgi:hypothetical protein
METIASSRPRRKDSLRGPGLDRPMDSPKPDIDDKIADALPATADMSQTASIASPSPKSSSHIPAPASSSKGQDSTVTQTPPELGTSSDQNCHPSVLPASPPFIIRYSLFHLQQP